MFLDPTRKQQKAEGNKKFNYNIINFNEAYFNCFLALFKCSLNVGNNKEI